MFKRLKKYSKSVAMVIGKEVHKLIFARAENFSKLQLVDISLALSLSKIHGCYKVIELLPE